MSKCPYCEANLSLEDFFVVLEKVSKKGKVKTSIGEFKGVSMSVKVSKKGKVKTSIGEFKGVSMSVGIRQSVKMWACPGCDTILGFSEYRYDKKM